jgi:hypothetical protein
MKAQPVAQLQGPDQAVFVDVMALNHLRLSHPVGVDAVERVEYEIRVIACRSVERHNRIENGEIRSWNEDQGFVPVRDR